MTVIDFLEEWQIQIPFRTKHIITNLIKMFKQIDTLQKG